MSGTSSHDSTLKEAVKKYDQALKEQELDLLGNVVEPDYVIHADGITLSVSSPLTIMIMLLRSPLQHISVESQALHHLA